ncbi:TonB-dependent receptor plug domain-containing protein [Chitinimonas lacunae]|uniref:TonB-dependent receptor plug domain-containing protein n=1 Tax=Chitinimonas lacunae TaxID=1963018 RepID=A0ABV8MQE8_9NEIS
MQKVEEVVVTGRQETTTEERQRQTATKLIFGRDELDRYGDSNLGDVLKRLPGVTLGGVPGRGGEIRMRGLGQGYTQILINDEPMARGFSLDSLSPDMVERIEITRGPLAEHSARAVAGTINIVLRQDVRKRQNEARLSAGFEHRGFQPGVSLQHSDKTETLSYTLAAALNRFDQRLHSEVEEQGRASDGRQNFDETSQAEQRNRGHMLHLAPRLNWRLGQGESLVVQGFGFSRHGSSQGRTLTERTLSGPRDPLAYPETLSSSDNDHQMVRLNATWQGRFVQRGRFNVRLGTSLHRNERQQQTESRDTAGELRRLVEDDSKTREQGWSGNGKWTLPLGVDKHMLAFGYNAEWSRRRERRQKLENGLPQQTDFGEQYEARTAQLAGFVQDEWEVTPQWALYGGLRWEGIETASQGGMSQRHRSSVWSPSLQGVWRLSAEAKDQVRFGLSRSYKTPNPGDLLGRGWRSTDNSPTAPDQYGNPDLKPELAWGLDFAFERYLSQGGLVSVSAFSRRIDNLIRRRTELLDGRWIAVPRNIARARTNGIELEAKVRLAELVDSELALDLRANYGRYWSSVAGVPGPDNRLADQIPQSLNLGFDYRLRSLPLSVGATVNWTPAYRVRVSEGETTRTGSKGVIDAYGLWRFSPAAQLRLSAGNLRHADYRQGSEIDLGGSQRTRQQDHRTYTSWNAVLELKF